MPPASPSRGSVHAAINALARSLEGVSSPLPDRDRRAASGPRTAVPSPAGPRAGAMMTTSGCSSVAEPCSATAQARVQLSPAAPPPIAWEANLVKAPRRRRGEVGSKPTPGTSTPSSTGKAPRYERGRCRVSSCRLHHASLRRCRPPADRVNSTWRKKTSNLTQNSTVRRGVWPPRLPWAQKTCGSNPPAGPNNKNRGRDPAGSRHSALRLRSRPLMGGRSYFLTSTMNVTAADFFSWPTTVTMLPQR